MGFEHNEEKERECVTCGNKFSSKSFVVKYCPACRKLTPLQRKRLKQRREEKSVFVVEPTVEAKKEEVVNAKLDGEVVEPTKVELDSGKIVFDSLAEVIRESQEGVINSGEEELTDDLIKDSVSEEDFKEEIEIKVEPVFEGSNPFHLDNSEFVPLGEYYIDSNEDYLMNKEFKEYSILLDGLSDCIEVVDNEWLK